MNTPGSLQSAFGNGRRPEGRCRAQPYRSPVKARRRSTLATAWALLITALAACGGVGEPKSSDLMPLPDPLRVVADTGGDCGSGREQMCDRGWVIVGESGGSREDVQTALISYLEDSRDWSFEKAQDGKPLVARLPDGRRGLVEPYAPGVVDVYDAKPLAASDERTAMSQGIEVAIIDCCGDGWPFGGG